MRVKIALRQSGHGPLISHWDGLSQGRVENIVQQQRSVSLSLKKLDLTDLTLICRGRRWIL